MNSQRESDAGRSVVANKSLDVRMALSRTMSLLQGCEQARGFQAFTLEEAADAWIEQTEGAGTKTRPNRIERVKSTASDIKAAMEQLKQLPPSDLLFPDEVESAAVVPEEEEEE